MYGVTEQQRATAEMPRYLLPQHTSDGRAGFPPQLLVADGVGTTIEPAGSAHDAAVVTYTSAPQHAANSMSAGATSRMAPPQHSCDETLYALSPQHRIAFGNTPPAQHRSETREYDVVPQHAALGSSTGTAPGYVPQHVWVAGLYAPCAPQQR